MLLKTRSATVMQDLFVCLGRCLPVTYLLKPDMWGTMPERGAIMETLIHAPRATELQIVLLVWVLIPSGLSHC